MYMCEHYFKNKYIYNWILPNFKWIAKFWMFMDAFSLYR